MTAILISIVGFFLIVQCGSSPTHSVNDTVEDKNINIISAHTKNDTIKIQIAAKNITQEKNELQTTIPNNQNVTTDVTNGTNNRNSNDSDVIIINLEEINKMPPLEYIGRQLKSLWDYILHGDKNEIDNSFMARCAGIAKKVRQLIPMVMIGGAVMMTKLAFLVLFSLKTIGLLGLLLLLNVGSAAAKLGALLASKKSEQTPQNIHFHVQKSDDHVYSSSHHGGPPYGLWDDRIDTNIEKHELYNLYEKLKLENDLRKYFAPGKMVHL